MKYLFPNGVRKALTLSYDDGVEADVQLVNILNRFGIKSTFNLNSGIQTKSHAFDLNGHQIVRLPKETVLTLYNGHEVAIHTLTHPKLDTLSAPDIYKELHDDKVNLEKWFNTPMIGMAYPFGAYCEDALNALEALNVQYGRTIENTGKFSLPTNNLLWHPTTHHNDPNLLTLVDQFINDDALDLQLFYLWGHSYEFDMDNNWSTIENFCHTIGNYDSIWYATNGEIITYLEAAKNLIFESSTLINNSSQTIWIEHLDKIYKVEANSSIPL